MSCWSATFPTICGALSPCLISTSRITVTAPRIVRWLKKINQVHVKVLLQDLIPVVRPLNDPHLPGPILRPDQMVVDKTGPAFWGRQRTDQLPPEMGLGRGLMVFIHGIEIFQSPWSKRKNIVYLKMLFGIAPPRDTQVVPPVDDNRVDDLVVMTPIALYFPRHDRQRD